MKITHYQKADDTFHVLDGEDLVLRCESGGDLKIIGGISDADALASANVLIIVIISWNELMKQGRIHFLFIRNSNYTLII